MFVAVCHISINAPLTALVRRPSTATESAPVAGLLSHGGWETRRRQDMSVVRS